MNDHAAGAIDEYATYEGPTAGFVEQVYLIEPYATPTGDSAALLANAAGDRAATMTWSTDQLPYLTLWKNTAATEDGYVTGIEPATGYPYNRSVERAAGRVPKLAPGQSRRFTLDISLHAGRQDVNAAIQNIHDIQRNRPTRINRQPPN
jgi:hypothetical protein